jgi:hypothetical protein
MLLAAPAVAGDDKDRDGGKVDHVLLISADGMHQSDLAWYVQTHPNSKLAALVSALTQRRLLQSTAIIVSAKHGQSPMKLAALNRIKDSQIIAALNNAWKSSHPGAAPVALGTDDDGMLLWLNDRSEAATDFARQFLLNYSDPTASVDNKPVTSAGLWQVYAGAAAAQLIGVDPRDLRVPDVIGIAQYGVVYKGGKGKIAEHWRRSWKTETCLFCSCTQEALEERR